MSTVINIIRAYLTAFNVAIAYALLAGLGWFTISVQQWLIRQRYTAFAEQAYKAGNGEEAVAALRIAGGRLSEVVIAAILAVVFLGVAAALARRGWNGWDWATIATGSGTVLTLIFLCASERVIFFAPITLAGMWLLLYRPGVKAACGVGTAPPAILDPEVASAAELVDLKQEQTNLAGLQQSLRVFELERGIPTDQFVARYAQGLEEETEDNQEWFALARMASRARDRIAASDGSGHD